MAVKQKTNKKVNNSIKNKAKNQIKKVAKKNKKNKSSFVIVLFVIILILAGITFFMYTKEKNNYESFVTELDGYFDELNFDNIDSNITLLNKYNDVDLVWETTDANIINLSGEIKKPTYKEGDKKVTLKVSAKYEGTTFLKGFINFEIYEKSFDVYVKCDKPTDEDYVNLILDSFYLPSEVYGSMKFETITCFDNCFIEWESENVNRIDNLGNVHPGAIDEIVKVNVTIYSVDENNNRTYSITKEYEIMIRSNEFEFNELDVNFNSSDETRSYSDLNIDGALIHNGMIVNKLNSEEEINKLLEEGETNEFPREVKLRTNNKNDDGNAYILINVHNGLKFSFDYLFDDKSHNTEKSYLSIYKVDDDVTLIEKIIVPIKTEFTNYNLDLSEYKDSKIKIEFSHDWSNESFIRIDNLKITRKIEKEDIDDIKIPLNISNSIMLPFVTKYGGSITWTSSDTNIISNNGKLNENLKENDKVILKASVNYGDISFEENFEINVNINNVTKDSLEIYFIDLGVYGLADCGESTYIKYNDIDIVVDGGDHFDSTNKAFSDCFDKYTSDGIIDYMIITHPDSDHIGGLPYIFLNYQVNNVYKFAGEEFTTQKFKNLKQAYDNEPNCNVYDIYSDVFNGSISERINISDDIYILFIDTGYLLDKETNGRSVVFELFAYNTKVLMTGDADNGGSHSKLENDYASKVGDIDILKVCHHGTENGTSSYFLSVTKPEVAIICNGNYLGNKHGHPNKGPLSRMNEYSKDLKIYAITGGGVNAVATSEYAYRGSCTLEESLIDRNGTIACKIDNNGYSFSCNYKEEIMDLRESTYWSILFN